MARSPGSLQTMCGYTARTEQQLVGLRVWQVDHGPPLGQVPSRSIRLH